VKTIAKPVYAKRPEETAEETAEEMVVRLAEEDLCRATKNILEVTEHDPKWTAVIAEIGAEELLKLIAMLQAVYDAHCKSSDVKSAADRAEAKAKVKLH
jgi:hypothetical protein